MRFNLLTKAPARSNSERFTFWFRLEAAVVLAIICSVTIPGCGDEKTPTVIRLDRPMVRVEIENRHGVKGSLIRIDGDRQTEVGQLDPANDPHVFLVPDGFYLIRPQSLQPDFEVAVPIPAVAEILEGRTLQIPLLKSPASETGWSWIPAGPAIVGDTIGVGAQDERPARIENVDGFWMAQTEVTNEQYAKFLSAQENVDPAWIDLDSRKCRVELADSENKSNYLSDAPRLPVVMVSLAGARAYCDWLTEKTGQRHRLPVEAEWEKAARGPESYIFAYGNIYQQSLANQQSGKLKEVGSYQPNSYGLFDMTGNAFEWMDNVNDETRPDRLLNQSLRGGSFVLDGMYLRNSFRMRQTATVMTDDIGFRVLRDPASSVE